MDEKPGCAALLLYTLTTVVAGTALRALALMACWGWFVIPVGAPHLGGWHLLGLSILGQVLIPHYPKTDEKGLTHEKMVLSLATAIAAPLLALAFGWFFHAMM